MILVCLFSLQIPHSDNIMQTCIMQNTTIQSKAWNGALSLYWGDFVPYLIRMSSKADLVHAFFYIYGEKLSRLDTVWKQERRPADVGRRVRLVSVLSASTNVRSSVQSYAPQTFHKATFWIFELEKCVILPNVAHHFSMLKGDHLRDGYCFGLREGESGKLGNLNKKN